MKKIILLVLVFCFCLIENALAYQTCSSVFITEGCVPCSYNGDDYDGVLSATEYGVRKTAFYKSASTTIDQSINHQAHRWDLVTSTNAAYFNGSNFQAKYTGNVISLLDTINDFKWYGAGALHTTLTLTPDPLEGGNITGTDVSCFVESCDLCEYEYTLGTKKTLTANPNYGFIFDRWRWKNGTASSTSNPTTFNVCEDIDAFAMFKQLISLQTALKYQTFSNNRVRTYYFTLSEATSVAIISGGSLDLRATLKNSSGSTVYDQNGNSFFNSYKDVGSVSDGANGHAQTNLMFRKQNLPAGTYTLEVTPETAQTSISGEFSLVFLKRPTNSAEFFAGMDALLDDNDASNDYLDIYVKALYPELYSSIFTITATSDYTDGCIDYNNVQAERQCKALINFYLHNILDNNYLRDDNVIQSTNWMAFDDADENCVADRDYIMLNDADGILVYHSDTSFGAPNCDSGKYYYNPNTQTVYRGDTDLEDYISQGDVFVKTGHYGLIYGYDEIAEAIMVLDTNWATPMDGKIRKGTDTSRYPNTWKVTRPQ